MNKEKAIKMANDFLDDTYLKGRDMYANCDYKTFKLTDTQEIDIGYVIDGEETGITCRSVTDGDLTEACSTLERSAEKIADCILKLCENME